MNGVNKNSVNNSATAGVNNAVERNCFVCDSVITDRFYTLSKCRTQRSKSRVIEKLGEILGEDYMIVVSDSDVICRSCANLVNTLDRLEIEMNTIQTVIHKFLKRKYTLNEDPNNLVRSPDLNSLLLHQSNELNTNSSSQNDKPSSSDKSSNGNVVKTTLKCEFCTFTTGSNCLMVNHIRKNHFMLSNKTPSSSTQTVSKNLGEKATTSTSNMNKSDAIIIDIPMSESTRIEESTTNNQKKRKITKVLQMNEDGGLQIVNRNSAAHN